MTESKWIDITQDILKLPKTFKLLELVKDQKFVLQDGMHAHQINDNKIDPKYNLTQQCTISYMLKNNKIKLPSELSLEEVLAIFMEVSKAQSLVLKNYPLYNTIYTFTYLYDSKIYSNQNSSKQGFPKVINALINSINYAGTYIYQQHKESCSVKEDDLNLCLFSFSNQFPNVDQINKDFTSIQTWLTGQIKQPKNKQKSPQYNLLNLLIKLRKAVHNLTKSMGKYYQPKSSAKIEKDIHTVISAVASVQQWINSNQKRMINSQQILKGTGIFNEDISKTLRCHYGPRDIPKISFKQSIQHIKIAMQQFQLFIPIPQRLSLLKQRIQKLQQSPLNLWSKSYIKNNLFHKQQYIFNTIKTEQVVLNDINDYIQIKQSWKQEQKFINCIKPTSPVVSEVLFRYLGKISRSFWEVSKVYEDFNILIHLSNQFDNTLSTPNKKQIHLSSWYYNFGLNAMIKQLISGIQTELYQHYQYPYVFYLLQNLLGVYDRNSQVFMKKFDKDYQKSFFDDSLNTKKKKKVSQAGRKYFTDAIFKKALHYYVRSFHRILFIMVNRKLLPNPFSENMEIHIQNRFRIFKNIYFVRTIDYKQYLHDFQVISKDEVGYLNQAMDLLKQAKNIFQKIIQLQQSDCFYKVKQDSQNLIKICIKCSLAVMSLKMGQNSKKYTIQNKNARYPQISIA